VNNREQLSSFLADTAAALSTEDMPTVDFDTLRTTLQDLIGQLEEMTRIREDLELLRDQYEGRIVGMLKAVAAVTDNRHRQREAVDTIESLPSLTCADLVKTFHRTSARFRDAFPTSFAPADSFGDSRRTITNVEDFK
jgi:hypothetical protein